MLAAALVAECSAPSPQHPVTLAAALAVSSYVVFIGEKPNQVENDWSP
jgi:hypothetical protein